MHHPLSYLTAAALWAAGSVAAGVAQPVLLWQKGGCKSYCETGWYSSPAVASLDGKGRQVIVATYGVAILDGKTGDTLHTYDPPGSRAWPGVVVADLEGKGTLSIVTAHGDGYVSVRDGAGKEVWSRKPIGFELRSLAVADLDHDGKLDIVVSAGRGSKENTWVYDAKGTLRAGWPQLADSSGYAWGVYNANVALGNLSGGDSLDIIVPSDVHYICAYHPDGKPLMAGGPFAGKAWGKIGVWDDTVPELRGYGTCAGSALESYRTNFAGGAAAIADVDGDGTYEVVVTGSTYDCSIDSYPEKYTGLYIFNRDRTRWKTWGRPAHSQGAALSGDYNVIETANPDPVIADLDKDTRREILFSSGDGMVHCFGLDKKERGKFPFSLNAPGDTDFAYPTPPVVADLDHDGHAEIIFGSWTKHDSQRKAYLYVLDDQGNELRRVEIPRRAGADFAGSLASPTLADVNMDGSMDVVLTTVNMGAVAYAIPGADTGAVLWATGRGNILRNGFVPGSVGLPGGVRSPGAPGAPAGARSGRILVALQGEPLHYLFPSEVTKARLYDLEGTLLAVLPVVEGQCMVPAAQGLRLLLPWPGN